MNSHLVEELDVPETVAKISSNAFSSKLHLGESEYCVVNNLLIGSDADLDIMAKNKSKKWKKQIAILKGESE